MKNWIKKQTTEFTAWVGAFLCLSAFLAPDWVFLTIGILLIAIDDERAKTIVGKLSPKAQKWIDDV